jgi:hypothetical protein
MQKRMVAFIANQPCANLEQVARVFAANRRRRHEIVAYYLFDRPCIAGETIAHVFSEELRRAIVWEHPYACVPDSARREPVDCAHVRRVIAKNRPHAVLSFGVPEIGRLYDGLLIEGPHPASRRVDTKRQLRQMSKIAAGVLDDTDREGGSPSEQEIGDLTRVIRESWPEGEWRWRLERNDRGFGDLS